MLHLIIYSDMFHFSWQAVSHFALTTRSMVSPMRAVL